MILKAYPFRPQRVLYLASIPVKFFTFLIYPQRIIVFELPLRPLRLAWRHLMKLLTGCKFVMKPTNNIQ
jgi:hypothetical protein